MSLELVPLAALMALVTYPSRALPLLAPGIERLPEPAIRYLRLVGPAVLAAIAATAVMVATDDTGRASLHVGIEWLAVGVAVVAVAWRRNLLLGLLVAAAIGGLGRAAGLA